jgi:hypothetical protein
MRQCWFGLEFLEQLFFAWEALWHQTPFMATPALGVTSIHFFDLFML